MFDYKVQQKPPTGDMRHGWQTIYEHDRRAKAEVHFNMLKKRLPPRWHGRLIGPGVNIMHYQTDSPPPTLPAQGRPFTPPSGSIAAAAADDEIDDYGTFI